MSWLNGFRNSTSSNTQHAEHVKDRVSRISRCRVIGLSAVVLVATTVGVMAWVGASTAFGAIPPTPVTANPMYVSTISKTPAPTTPPGTDTSGTSDAQSRREAIGELQRLALTPEGRHTVSWVLENAGVYRRLPTQRIPCDPAIYQFCVNNPDVVISIWEVLKATQLHAERTESGLLRITDNAGMEGFLQMLHTSETRHLAFVDGVYQGTFMPGKIRGRGILLLGSSYSKDGDGRTWIECRMDAFFNVEPGSIEFLTRTLMPVVGKTSDENFEQTTAFLAHLSHVAKERPATIPWFTQQMETVPAEVRNQFVAVAASRTTATSPVGGGNGSGTETSVSRVPADPSVGTPLPTSALTPSASPSVSGNTTPATSGGLIAPTAPDGVNGAALRNTVAPYSHTAMEQPVLWSTVRR